MVETPAGRCRSDPEGVVKFSVIPNPFPAQREWVRTEEFAFGSLTLRA